MLFVIAWCCLVAFGGLSAVGYNPEVKVGPVGSGQGLGGGCAWGRRWEVRQRADGGRDGRKKRRLQ